MASQNIGVKLVIPHGGVTATHFSDRPTGDAALEPSLTDHAKFVARTNAASAKSDSGAVDELRPCRTGHP